MAEPQGNDGDVDFGVQKVHGRGVPEGMHGDVLWPSDGQVWVAVRM
jgi:hypothetical protein